MPLTDFAIRAEKAGSTVKKISDGGGLQLWISPAGGKSWNYAYRFEGRQKKLHLGSYPEVSLRDARSKRDAARTRLVEGEDPAAEKQIAALTRSIARAETFEAVAAEFSEKRAKEGIAETTKEKAQWLLEFALPRLGKRPIAEISSAEILAVLKSVEATGKYETALRLRSAIGRVFRYGIATARCANDPTTALRGALIVPTPKHRAALLDPVRVAELLRAIDANDGGSPIIQIAMKLMALLAPRPGELRLARWSEFDLDRATWTIPAARAKMRREHAMPLPRQAVELLRTLHPQTGRGVAGLVFPSVRSVARPLSENTMNAMLRRLGFSQNDMTSHGFRSIFSTFSNESGLWSRDAIERQLAHQDPDEVRRAYSRGSHWQERIRLMQWWADKLDAMRVGATVLHLDKARG